MDNVIDAKWVYTWKVDEQGWVVNAKSRLVARGFKQREGIDFGDTFAPTVSSSCLRLLSAIASLNRYTKMFLFLLFFWCC